MTQGKDNNFLHGRIESLKRQLAECKAVKERCKSKNIKLAQLLKILKSNKT